MSPKRIFRLAYPTQQSIRIHQLRDADAFVELSQVLYASGYEFGGLLLNRPAGGSTKAHPVDVSALTSSDLLVLNTRPPLDDKEEEDKKFVQSSDSSLEEIVFGALRHYFDKCARSRVRLSQPVARQLPDLYKQRADITFREYTDGSYLKYRGHSNRYWQKPNLPNLSAFYLVQTPAIWQGGPGLLAAFAMSGTETLIWNYLLRTRFPEWVGSCQFLMAEVELGKPPRQPGDLSFANDWKIEPILQMPFTTKPISSEKSSSATKQNRTK